MKKCILTFVFILLICISYSFTIYPSAASAKIQDNYRIVNGETYAFRDAFELAVKDLDADKKEKTKFDDTPWNVKVSLIFPSDNSVKNFEGKFTYQYWGRESSSWATNLRGLSYNIMTFDNHHIAVEWNIENKEDKNIYISSVSDWDIAEAVVSLDFTAPKDGKIVLYDTFDNTIDACIDKPLNAFLYQKPEKKGYTFSILKNDKKIWPTDKEGVLMDRNNPSIPFPDLGEINVKKGDVISIKVVGGQYPNGQFFTINPEVGYTSVEVEKPQNDKISNPDDKKTQEKENNNDNVEDEDIETTPQIDNNQRENNTQVSDNNSSNTNKSNDVENSKNDILIIGLTIGVLILLVGGIAAVVIIKKKKI